jgi:hypothetical protein
MMQTRTWPYGTTLNCSVITRDKARHLGQLVDVLTVGCKNEAYILIGHDHGDAAVGDKGTITFLQGGPTGGYWKFKKSQTPEA